MLIVKTEEQLQKVCAILKEQSKIAIDCETTGLNRKLHELVGISIAWSNKDGVNIPLKHVTEPCISLDVVIKHLSPILSDPAKLFIGHNMQFDILFLHEYGFPLIRAGFDTLVASKLLLFKRDDFELKSIIKDLFNYNMNRLSDFGVSFTNKKSTKIYEVPLDQISHYAIDDVIWCFKLQEHLCTLFNEKSKQLFYLLEMKITNVIISMMKEGLHIRVDYLKSLEGEMQQMLSTMLENMKTKFGDINYNSSEQVATLLFDKFGLPVVKRNEDTNTPSTDKEALLALQDKHLLPKYLLEYRAFAKLQSTYVRPMIKRQQSDGGIFPTFSQTGTDTWRFSSSKPNMQNIPKHTEWGIKVKSGFIPNDPASIFVSADYSQIDYRSLAVMSKDSELIKMFFSDIDLHKQTATKIFNIPVEQVTDEQRHKAKTTNFGIVNGQWAGSLAIDLGCSQAEAQELIDRFTASYPGVQKWKQQLLHFVQTYGYSYTYLGHKRYFPWINSKEWKKRSFSERAAINTAIQGTSADIIKVAMMQIFNRFENDTNIKMLVQVHDDILFSIRREMVDVYVPQIINIMENCIKLPVPLKVDVKIGENWGEMNNYKIPVEAV